MYEIRIELVYMTNLRWRLMKNYTHSWLEIILPVAYSLSLMRTSEVDIRIDGI